MNERDPQFSDDELAFIRDTCIVQAVEREAKGTALSLRFARAYEDIGFKADAALKARASHHNAEVAADDEDLAEGYVIDGDRVLVWRGDESNG